MPGVLVRWAAGTILAITGLTLALWAQNSGGSGLVVQVNPEAHLNPSTARLSFAVSKPGETVVGAPVTITAWVRSLPNQRILLTAQPVYLTGPSAAAAPPVSAITWSGAMANATGGAAAAVCASGSFGAGGPQPLISGWTRSGIATCTVTFALATDAAWPQGVYSGQVAFNLLAQ